MKPATIALLSAGGAAALYSWLSPTTTPEPELLRVRRSTPSPVGPAAHVLGPADARTLHKLDAEGGPLSVWIELPAGPPYLVRRVSGSAIVRPLGEHVRDGIHMFGFELRTSGDVRFDVRSQGRVLMHFNVQGKNVGRLAR